MTIETWQFLTTRNRSTANGRPNMIAASNPGGRGHAWIKALFVDKRPAAGMELHEYNSSDYSFTPARLGDNPHLLRKNPEYLKTLEKLPIGLRMALLEGSWNVHAGQYFDVFDRNAHVTSDLGLESYFPRWIGVDWGFAHSCCAYWVCERPDGKIVVYRELVVRGESVADIAERIVTLSAEDKIEDVFLSPDAFAKRSEERSIAERFGEVFSRYGIPQPTSAVNNRLIGWRYLHDLLTADRILISDTCTSLIEKIPQAIHDDREGHEEDILKQAGDDEIDAWRYAVMSRERRAVKPYALRLAERVTASDPTSRAIQARVAKIEIGKESMHYKLMGARRMTRA